MGFRQDDELAPAPAVVDALDSAGDKVNAGDAGDERNEGDAHEELYGCESVAELTRSCRSRRYRSPAGWARRGNLGRHLVCLGDGG